MARGATDEADDWSEEEKNKEQEDKVCEEEELDNEGKERSIDP